MSKKAQLIQIVLFLAFIGLFFLLHLCLPDRDFSQRENRVMQEAPAFSLSELFSGRFTTKFEKYMTDQFPGRDLWISMKSRMELLEGKQENNGVYLCPTTSGPLDYMLIERFNAPSEDAIAANVSSLNRLRENVDAEVYFALIPGAGEIRRELLPENAPMDSQRAVIEKAYGQSKAANIDVFSALEAHRDEYIFYGTDHHWTTRGAFYGASAIGQAMDFSLGEPWDYAVTAAASDFLGTTYSSSGFTWVQPDRIERWVEPPEGLSITNYPAGEPVEGTLYDDSFLARKDKYASFLGGNTPLLEIDTGVRDKPSLLILRDSYADSMIPFLLRDFSHISVIDLRYYRNSLADYIRENSIDRVLVCYSVANFSTDTNLFLLGL